MAKNSLRFCCFLKFPEEFGKFPDVSLIFYGKAISLSFLECVGTLANSGGCYSICVHDICGTLAPSYAIYGATLAQ